MAKKVKTSPASEQGTSQQENGDLSLTPEQEEAIYLKVLKQKQTEDTVDLTALANEDFSLTLKEIELKGDLAGYTIVELDGTRRDDYDTQLYDEYMTLKGETWVVTKHDGFLAILLSRVIRNPRGEFVSIEEAQSWPDGVQHKLYAAAKQISKLGRTAKADAAKKS